MGPEVLLKASAMVSNKGFTVNGIITADFDMREESSDKMKDDSKQEYYFRDQKSIVTRIPEAFNGKGYYIKGDQRQTFPYLYKKIIDGIKEE